MKQINTIDELNIALQDKKSHDFVMHLNGGVFSRKTIRKNNKEDKYSVLNHIDNCKQILTSKELMDESITNIGKAIKQGSFSTL